MALKVAYVGAPLDFEVEGVVQIPVLEIVYQDLSGLRKIEGAVVFTSKRGVISLKNSGVALTDSRAYCIGTQTSTFLRNLYSLECKVPQVQNSDALADILIGSESFVQLVSSDHVSTGFIEKLKRNGIKVNHIVAYRIEENKKVEFQPLRDVEKILVGSSLSFKILARNAGGLLSGKELYAIGKPTEATMNRLGYYAMECFSIPDIRTILNTLLTKR